MLLILLQLLPPTSLLSPAGQCGPGPRHPAAGPRWWNPGRGLSRLQQVRGAGLPIHTGLKQEQQAGSETPLVKVCEAVKHHCSQFVRG